MSSVEIKKVFLLMDGEVESKEGMGRKKSESENV